MNETHKDFDFSFEGTSLGGRPAKLNLTDELREEIRQIVRQELERVARPGRVPGQAFNTQVVNAPVE
jgi:hypothetical protein